MKEEIQNEIDPCWINQDCTDGRQGGKCPANEAWVDPEGRKFCFEVATDLCIKVLASIGEERGKKNAGSLSACSSCDYFKDEVSPKLPKGEAMRRLIEAKLQTDADGDKYQADRASADVVIQPRVEFLVEYEETENIVDKILLLEARLGKIQTKIGNDTLQYAEDYHFIRTEMDKLRGLLLEGGKNE